MRSLPVTLHDVDIQVVGPLTHRSLKNRTSCCSSVTASKDKSGSHLSGVLGGGFLENSEAKLGLIPAGNRSEQVKFLFSHKQDDPALKYIPSSAFSYQIMSKVTHVCREYYRYAVS